METISIQLAEREYFLHSKHCSKRERLAPAARLLYDDRTNIMYAELCVCTKDSLTASHLVLDYLDDSRVRSGSGCFHIRASSDCKWKSI